MRARPDGSRFIVGEDGTISPAAAPGLVLGLRYPPTASARVTAAVVVPENPTSQRYRSRRSSLNAHHPSLAQQLAAMTALSAANSTSSAKIGAARGGTLEDALEELALQLCVDQHEVLAERLEQVTAPLLLEQVQHFVTVLRTPSASQRIPSASQRRALRRAVWDYAPTGSEANQKLLQQMDSIRDNTESMTDEEAQEPPPPPPPLHPMRGTSLANALRAEVWVNAGVGALFRKVQTTTAWLYSLSRDVKQCDLFLSHSWRDIGRRKAYMLLFYQCTSDMIAGTRSWFR